jgi:hypothetical protein
MYLFYCSVVTIQQDVPVINGFGVKVEVVVLKLSGFLLLILDKIRHI